MTISPTFRESTPSRMVVPQILRGIFRRSSLLKNTNGLGLFIVHIILDQTLPSEDELVCLVESI